MTFSLEVNKYHPKMLQKQTHRAIEKFTKCTIHCTQAINLGTHFGNLLNQNHPASVIVLPDTSPMFHLSWDISHDFLLAKANKSCVLIWCVFPKLKRESQYVLYTVENVMEIIVIISIERYKIFQKSDNKYHIVNSLQERSFGTS